MSESRRLNIAFVVDRFGNRFGGAEAYGVALMRELAERHEVTVFAREYDRACDLHLPFRSLRSWSGWPSWIRVLLFAWRARAATKGKFDIVHSHMNGWCGDVEVVHVTPVRYNWRVRPLPRMKKWISCVSLRVQTYLRLEARRVAPRPAHRTVAVSGLIAEQLRQAYGADFVAPIIAPGVGRPEKLDAAQRQAARAAMGFTADDHVCLLVARNPLRKGLPTIVEALKILPANVKLLVVGGDASTRDYVRKTAGLAQQSERVQLVDETADVDQYYSVADVYVHPTLNDSFGMAPLEAMSFGVPVVLSPSRWCGFAQYVRHDLDALVLSHPEDSEGLARSVLSILHDPVLRERLVRGADALVERHGWPRVAAQYESLYDEILLERRQGD